MQPLAAFQAWDGRAACLSCKDQPALHVLRDDMAKAGLDPNMHPEIIEAIPAQSCSAYAAEEARWSWLPFPLLAGARCQDLDGQPAERQERRLACMPGSTACWTPCPATRC